MQKKILRTTALILCFCILLLAVPNTFARSGKSTKFDASRSRFFFESPVAFMTSLPFLSSIFNHNIDRTSTTPPDENTTNSKIKITVGTGHGKVSDD
jgi:hypothetical protein